MPSRRLPHRHGAEPIRCFNRAEARALAGNAAAAWGTIESYTVRVIVVLQAASRVATRRDRLQRIDAELLAAHETQ
jgi:hypothetical protein